MVERTTHQIVETYLALVEDAVERERKTLETQVAGMERRINEILDYVCERLTAELEKRNG